MGIELQIKGFFLKFEAKNVTSSFIVFHPLIPDILFVQIRGLISPDCAQNEAVFSPHSGPNGLEMPATPTSRGRIYRVAAPRQNGAQLGELRIPVQHKQLETGRNPDHSR